MSMSQTHKEMDEKAMKHLPFEGKKFESTTFQNSSLTVEVFRVLQSLRKNELFCDIKIQTNDGKLIHAHKVVLASASQFFLAMFTNFIEKDKDHIYMESLNYKSLELIISYIYTAQIIVNEENVLDLLAAANFLSVDYIKDVCCDFLGTQLDPSNCIGIYKLANSYDCTELKACSDVYIKTQFKEVVKYEEFLSLPPEELIEIISSNDLNAPLEQNVFETVINWVQQESDVRKQYFKNVMVHVRLPLISNEYILNNIVGHPLVEISPECKHYVNYALHYNFNKTIQKITIPNKICCTRRSGNFDKIILMLSWAEDITYINWYDPATNHWNITSKISQNDHGSGRILLIKDQFVLIVQPHGVTSEIIDLSSLGPRWIPMRSMKVGRRDFGLGSIDHCVYVVGGICAGLVFESVMTFDISAQEWQMVASMSSKRGYLGVCVLNNLLYAIGGYDYSKDNMYLKSVECYDPSLDTWKHVAEMSEGRSDLSIGVLNGIIYAIGGCNELGYCKYVEAYKPSDGFWTRKADLHLARMRPEVVILHGLMYVISGRPFRSHNDSVEIYNPKTNTWKLMESCIKGKSAHSGAVVIDRPPNF